MVPFPPPDVIYSSSWNGIEFARLALAGKTWRLGTINPAWQEKLHGAWWTPAGLKALASEGIQIIEEKTSPLPLIAMCCGLGSIWPGMGRELYASFPAAAKAMDHIARLADWDILALMDERNLNKISQTRWQIPYLFMLEYAQWHLLQSLGIQGTVFCGHSLGELIALCLAGVYSVESAWYLLETRAEHMAELEAKGCRKQGMLAVPAEYAEIAPILEKWPDLRISNRNTHKQYILGGDRDQLLEARRMLRRKRIPAILLNMNMAFHNPAMRILRSISFRRLNGLDMTSSDCPVLSCVDAAPYPDNKGAICARIADLDENTVDWVVLTETLQTRYPEGIFLELGPQETLCGLTSELLPGRVCVPVDKKGHEANAMRLACACLFAEGFIRTETIAKMFRQPAATSAGAWYIPNEGNAAENSTLLKDIDPAEQTAIIKLVAEAAGCAPSDVLPEMDLRQDLAVRSSHFPFLMLEAERELGRPVILENLFRIITVGDLIRFLTGSVEPNQAEGETGPRELFQSARRPLQRLIWKEYPVVAAINPCSGTRRKADKILAVIDDPVLKPFLLDTLAIQGTQISQDMDPVNPENTTPNADGIIIALPPIDLAATEIPHLSHILENLEVPDQNCWVYILQRFTNGKKLDAHVKFLEGWFNELHSLPSPQGGINAIALLESPIPSQNWHEISDLLALEIKHGCGGSIVWSHLESNTVPTHFCPSAPIFSSIIPAWEQFSQPDGSVFNGLLQYSCFENPELCRHGANAAFTPLSQYEPPETLPNAAWLPLGEILGAICNASIISSPWLIPVGYTGVNVFRLPAVAPGITRECRVAVTSRLSLQAEGVAARQARTHLEVAAVSANGRKTGNWLHMADGRCILGIRDAAVPPIWDTAENDQAASWTLPLDELYNLLALPEEWRLVSKLLFSEDKARGIIKRLPPAPENALFTPPYKIMDAALLGSMALICNSGRSFGDASHILGKWRFTAIDFIRFDSESIKKTAQADIQMEWRLSWKDTHLLRYDIQASASGVMLMTIQNLEFDRIAAPGC